MAEETAITLGEDLGTAEEVPSLPESDYPAIIKDVKREPNKAGDGFNIVWDFMIQGTGRKDDSGRPYDGRIVSAWDPLPKPGDENEFWGQGQTAREGKLLNIKEKLDAIGYNYGKEGTIDFAKIKGAKCIIHTRPDTFAGRPTNRLVAVKKVA